AAREEPAGLHHRADDGLSARSEGSRAPGQEDRERARVRSGHLTRPPAAPAHRRASELFRWPDPARHGASHPVRPSVARRRQRSGEDAQEALTKGRPEMMAALVNHLWQSTLVAGLAWLATLALKRERAGVRYGVWLAASLKFLIPFSALTSLGARFGWHPVVVAVFTPHDVAIDAGGGALSPQALRIAAHPSAGIPAVRSLWNAAPELLLAVWALGAATLLTTWIVRWRRLSTIARQSTPLTEGPLVEALRAIERRAGITRPILVAISESSLEPGVFGVLTPTLVWPTRLTEHLSSGQIEAILAHEVTHVK